jgi:Fic family protein
LRLGYGVARYVSVEQLIYESKNSYYEALRQSQQAWHQAKHSIWPWTEYLLRILADAYEAFESRVAAERSMEGMTKQERVRHHILNSAGQEFRLRDLRKALPGISDPTFRIVLGELKTEGRLEASGGGPGATWVRLDATRR